MVMIAATVAAASATGASSRDRTADQARAGGKVTAASSGSLARAPRRDRRRARRPAVWCPARSPISATSATSVPATGRTTAMAAAAATEATTSSGPAGDRAVPVPAGAPGDQADGGGAPPGAYRTGGSTSAKLSGGRPAAPAGPAWPPAFPAELTAAPAAPTAHGRVDGGHPAGAGSATVPGGAKGGAAPAGAAAAVAVAPAGASEDGSSAAVRRHSSAVSGLRAGSRDNAWATSAISGAGKPS